MTERDTSTQIAILQALQDRSPRRVIEIAQCLDKHPVTIDRTCAQLQDRGDIRLRDRDKYELTSNGSDRISNSRDLPER
jgi:Mn-dependent DtxR family transcriptional regulator